MQSLLLAALLAVAMDPAPSQPPTEYLRRVALNGTAASRTITIDNSAGLWDQVNLEVWRTRSAGTDLTLTCLGTLNKTATPESVLGTCSFDASGNCTYVAATMVSTADASEKLAWIIKVRGWLKLACTFASTSAGAGDLITVTGRMVAQ